MEVSPSSEAASCAAIQELPSILCNPKVHYPVHKSPSLVPILGHINPVHNTPSHRTSILILFSHLRLGLPSGIFPSYVPLSIFLDLDRISKGSVQVRGSLWHFETIIFLRGAVVGLTHNPKLEDRPLSAVHYCLFNIFAATLNTWRPCPLASTCGRAMPR
jgi:hypothetical protein